MDLEHEQRLTEVEGRSKSNSHRIDKLEKQTEAINTLATNMAVMVEKQGEISDKVGNLDEKITTLEAKPAKRWDDLMDKIFWAVCAAVIAFLLGRLGLG